MEPAKRHKPEETVLVRAQVQAQAQARTVNHLFDLPPELLGEVLGHYIRDPAPWRTHPKTLAQVNRSIDALEGILKRAGILRLILPTSSRVSYGLRRQYVTAAMLHILRKQKLLLERHVNSPGLNCTNWAGLRAIYEATWYQVTFVQMMVKDGIEDHTKWRFFLERLKKVELYPAYEGYVGGTWQGLQEVVQL